jgi:hypothetical protein
MVAVHEELARPRVLATLEDLAAGGASGVFEVAGNPSGAVYLDGGRIAYARASWVPGLAALLRARYPVLAVPPPGRDADDITIADLAVQRGCLTRAGLEEILRSIVIDAFLVLTVPLAADSPVTAMSFTSTRTYWTELFPRLRLDSVREEALRRGKRVAQCGLSPTTRVTLRDIAAPATVLTREQWAIACQIGLRGSGDGRGSFTRGSGDRQGSGDLRAGELTSARDLAMLTGRALSETVESLGSLIRAGVCAPVRGGEGVSLPAATPPHSRSSSSSASPVSPPPSVSAPSVSRPPAMSPPASVSPPASATAPAAAAPLPAPVPAERGPASRPASESAPVEPLPTRSSEPRPSARVAGRGRPPTTEILRQVLSGLRKLS